MQTPEQPPGWAPPGWPAHLLARVEALPAWVRANLPAQWWSMPAAELKTLPEPRLLACYRASRAAPESREAREAATAIMDAYREPILRLVRHYAPRGRGGADPNIISHPPARLGVRNRDDVRHLDARDQDLYTQAWLALFEALEHYDPSRKAGLMTYAGYTIKEALIKQLLSSLPQEPHSDDTRKAWDRTLATWARLAQDWGRQPSPDEVAVILAPHLLPAIATVERARRAILDVFRVLIDNKVSLDEPDEDNPTQITFAQVADNTWDPAEVIDRRETHLSEQARMLAYFRAAAAKLGDEQAAHKLLVIRLLLNLKDSDRGSKMDFGMYKIKEFINNPTAEIAERWSALWTDYSLGRYGLPADWEPLRHWFEPPVEVADLRAFYRFSLRVAGWDRHGELK